MSNNNISEMNQSLCCGCRACEQVCPVHCISMVKDKEGFLVPKIDSSKCIQCGKCLRHCAQIEYNQSREKYSKVYAAKNKNKDIVSTSTSGGIFDLLARYVLCEKSGIVCGCAWDKKIVARHIIIDKIEDLPLLHGSKYVQSDIGNNYSLIKDYLDNGRFVLFSGTACQIAGVKQYLMKDYDNLITIDIICHGVPSPLLFKEYIKWKEKQIGNKITNFDFRNKNKKGWGLSYKVVSNKKNIIGNAWDDPYYTSFLNGDIYRECCYNCHYSNENRVSDITLGDYWGIEREHPNFYDDMGVSVVIVNSQKGIQLFDLIKSNIDCIESSYEKAARQNHNLVSPSLRTEIRNKIKEIDTSNYEKLFCDILRTENTISRKIKFLIPLKVKRILKRLRKR